MVEAYMRPSEYHPAMTRAEAEEKVGECLPTDRDRVERGTPDEITWWDLSRVAGEDPDVAREAWARIRRAAQDELATGHRSATAIEVGYESPISRAQYLALRNTMVRDWGPVNGTEMLLIDTIAHAFSEYLQWMKTLTCYTSMQERECVGPKDWQPPRLNSDKAVDNAAAMADRFNRILLRNLRALRDLRRYSPNVTIQQAGQVNVGGQQVNFAGGAPPQGPGPGQGAPTIDGTPDEAADGEGQD
jgi:hypothetical protein